MAFSGVNQFTVTATVSVICRTFSENEDKQNYTCCIQIITFNNRCRTFSENEDKQNYYFYRSCTNDCISGCTPLDDVEN
ncbi:hypothetical protein T4D_5250 [Trichinella pseudospiralis]|uniref:Uncharacterized protein n=1 Tax=Trichinella pseudospiralis TaxID=6337 RepID=A0A0V1FX74_TRIPS|nr:hypothetical protein T4D_5250 [Trichinella pseudospiralis]